MKLKLLASALVLGVGIAAAPGCAVDSGAADDGDSAGEAEKSSTSEAALHQYAADLAGAFHGDFHAGTQLPAFDGIVFKADGTFFADANTGIVCVRAPCPSQARISGRFFATRSYLYLYNVGGDLSNGVGGLRGWYRYTHSKGHKLSLERPWKNGWQQSLAPEVSYCSAPKDCTEQLLAQPRCIGEWTCGASDESRNQCHFACGMPSSEIWPATATKLVAHNSGGGFTPPPPAGSNCAIGMSKYTLDVATNNLAWEECRFVDWSTPLTLETGTKVLSAAEKATVDAAMKDVKISRENICGADKPFMTLEVTTPAGAKKYTDSFYSCMGNGPFVDNIGGVFSAMRSVAH